MALRILICDDIPEEAENLRGHLLAYGTAKGVSMDITACCDGSQIIDALEQSRGYDIIFLDIYMDRLNGMSLARQLRKHNSDSRLVFFSTSMEYALEAFGVNATQYLVKPVAYDAVENTMNQVMRGMNQAEEVISLTASSGIANLKLADLVCSETQRHYQVITLADGRQERVRISCSALFEQLSHRPEFVKLGASFIVNLQYVLRLTATNVELTTGSQFPVPRGAYSELKKKYFDYFASA